MKGILKALLRPSDSALFSKAMSAGFWAVALRVVLRGALIVRTIILARILTPEDFGLIAVAAISIALLDRFTQSGIDAALVQKTGNVKGFLDTAWTTQIVRGLLMAAILVLAAPLISQFFGAPEAQSIIQVLSISIVITAFTNIGIVLFTKDLHFSKLFTLEVATQGLDILVSIGAALALRNVWALVIGVLAGAVGRVVVSYIISSFRPRLRWTRSQFRRLFAFGKWILASNALSFISANLDDIAVGRVLGVQSLGWYRMAYNFSQAIATEVTQVTSQVAFPAYSKLQDASERLQAAYLGTVHLVAFLGFPVAVGTILVADDLVIGVLGGQWLPIIVPMQILSVAGLVKGVSATVGPLFQSQGRPDLPARFIFGAVVIMGILLYPAINRFGLNGAATVVVIAQTLTGVPALVLAMSMVHATRRAIVQALGYPSLNVILMAVAVLAVQYLFSLQPTALSLVVLAVTGILAYLGAVTLSIKMLGYAAPADLLGRVRGAVQ